MMLLANLVVLAPLETVSQAAAGPTVIQVSSAGSTSFQSNPAGGDLITDSEIDTAVAGGDADNSDGQDVNAGVGVNRTIKKGSNGVGAGSSGKAKSNPEFITGNQGLNFNQQRFANGGNQFSVEPPDQALCVGGGYVLEAVNDVLRVFDTNANPVSGVVDLNTFYNYPAAINRANGKRGPSLTDPVCHFDTDTGRFFVVVLTLDHIGTTPSLSGTNHLDIAVSDSSNPLGGWHIYKIPAHNNGQDGTPNHNCANGFCLGDYPHIGADANGIYLTTNEFATLGPGFYGAQIYGISKRQLAANAATVNVVLFNTADFPELAPKDGAGFTVWPAISPAGQANTDNGGTEFFLSSRAVFEDTGLASELIQWKLTNTSSLDSALPAVQLSANTIATEAYAVPPLSTQKSGDRPLGTCTTIAACAAAVGARLQPTITQTGLASNDSRMQQVFYANGKLWGALDTGLIFTNGGPVYAGIAYFVLNPNSKKVVNQGYLGLPGNNLTYPAVAVTASGRGVIAFTLTGADYYPSAGYASLDANIGVGDIHVAGAGVGPWDSFTGYRAAFGTSRGRWGDYGAAAVDGNNIWLASEYIAQTCTYAQFAADFTCGGTRGALGNWSTFISKLNM